MFKNSVPSKAIKGWLRGRGEGENTASGQLGRQAYKLTLESRRRGVSKKIQMNTERLEEAQAVRSEQDTEEYTPAHTWMMELAETLQINGRLLAREMLWPLLRSYVGL